MKPFVLIDRDGTLIVEKNYLAEPSQVELITGAGNAVGRLNRGGWGVCVVTNQSGIGRGYFDECQVAKVHARIDQLLAQAGAKVDGFYVCPHLPKDACACRKPAPGLVYMAVTDHSFNPADAWVIGDKDVDIDLARNIGARSILVRTGYGRMYENKVVATMVVDGLAEAVDFIIGEAKFR